MAKTKPTEYEPVAPPDDWKADTTPPAVIVKRPLIKIDLTTSAARTFGRFLIWTLVAGAVESVAYLIIAGLASAPGVVGTITKTVEIVDRREWGSAFTFYPLLLIILIAIYIIAMVVWFLNHDDF